MHQIHLFRVWCAVRHTLFRRVERASIFDVLPLNFVFIFICVSILFYFIIYIKCDGHGTLGHTHTHTRLTNRSTHAGIHESQWRFISTELNLAFTNEIRINNNKGDICVCMCVCRENSRFYALAMQCATRQLFHSAKSHLGAAHFFFHRMVFFCPSLF